MTCLNSSELFLKNAAYPNINNLSVPLRDLATSGSVREIKKGILAFYRENVTLTREHVAPFFDLARQFIDSAKNYLNIER